MMAILVLSSTFSFAVGKHFCGDFLIDSSIFSETKKCSSENHTKKPCCKDTLDLIEGQDELQQAIELQVDFDAQLFVIAFAAVLQNLFEYEPKQKIPFQYYEPPDLVVDIQLMDAVFLI